MKRNISYILNSANATKGLDAFQMSIVVKKNGEIIAQPKLLMGLNSPALIQQKNPEGTDDFEIGLEPSIVN